MWQSLANDPWPIFGVLFVLAILAAWWSRQSNSKPAFLAAILLLIAAIVPLFAGLFVDTPAKQINKIVEELVAAGQARDHRRIADALDPNYNHGGLHQGETRATHRARIHAFSARLHQPVESRHRNREDRRRSRNGDGEFPRYDRRSLRRARNGRAGAAISRSAQTPLPSSATAAGASSKSTATTRSSNRNRRSRWGNDRVSPRRTLRCASRLTGIMFGSFLAPRSSLRTPHDLLQTSRDRVAFTTRRRRIGAFHARSGEKPRFRLRKSSPRSIGTSVAFDPPCERRLKRRRTTGETIDDGRAIRGACLRVVGAGRRFGRQGRSRAISSSMPGRRKSLNSAPNTPSAIAVKRRSNGSVMNSQRGRRPAPSTSS